MIRSTAILFGTFFIIRIGCLPSCWPLFIPYTRTGALTAVTEDIKTSQDFGLRLSIPKTKVVAAGREVCSKDCSSIQYKHDNIEYEQDFMYVGSTPEASGN